MKFWRAQKMDKIFIVLAFPFIYIYYKWKFILILSLLILIVFIIDFIIWNYTKKSLYHKIKKILGF